MSKSILARSSAPTYQISSVDRALTLLTVIGEQSQVLVTEAAAILGTSPSTAHRILQTLVHHGYVVQGDHRAYRRGPAMESLSRGTRVRRNLVDVARPHLDDLTSGVNATSHLAALEGNGARFIAGAQPPGAADDACLRIGWLLPAHVVAAGKALLSEMTNEALSLLYPGGVPLTRSGRIHSLPQLRRELIEVRRRGFARSVGEAAEAVHAVAVSVPTPPGTRRYALSLGWTEPALTPHDERNVVRVLQDAAAGLAEDLGSIRVPQAS